MQMRHAFAIVAVCAALMVAVHLLASCDDGPDLVRWQEVAAASRPSNVCPVCECPPAANPDAAAPGECTVIPSEGRLVCH